MTLNFKHMLQIRILDDFNIDFAIVSIKCSKATVAHSGFWVLLIIHDYHRSLARI